ncbi:MAG: hypothetical protein KGL35_15425 [Bradyrhizobium sp.]|nr:hypothetical protein [Bradyrhizobium sp.]
MPLQPFVAKPYTTPQASQPRFAVKLDGNWYLGKAYDYRSNAHGATDQASVALPVSGFSSLASNAPPGFSKTYPDWTLSIQRAQELGNANQPVVVELWAGFPSNPSALSASSLSGLVLRFRGIVDAYSVKLYANTTTFTCRSLAAPLASTQITTPFPRQDTMTTTAFLQAQCNRFGLQLATPKLAAAPNLMIDVLGGEFISGVRNWYIWALMVQCAQLDNVDIWVDRTGTLHYEAATLVTRARVPFTWGRDCTEIEGTHSPQYSKNVQVQVHSWTKRTRTTSATRATTGTDGSLVLTSYTRQVTSTPIFGTTQSLTTSISSNGTVTTGLSSSSGGSSSGSTGYSSSATDTGKERYYFFPQNKTKDQCLAMAQAIWYQISEHEYSITIDAPVTPDKLPLVDVTANIALAGHPMQLFNKDLYFPREIDESFDAIQGFGWRISAVNHQLPQGAV